MAKERITVFIPREDIEYLFELCGFLTQTEKEKFTPSNIIHLLVYFFREIARQLKIKIYPKDGDPQEVKLLAKILDKINKGV